MIILVSEIMDAFPNNNNYYNNNKLIISKALFSLDHTVFYFLVV